MTNPSAMEQLGREHRRETLEAGRIRRAAGPPFPRTRERVGWSLIGLGFRLALDGRGSGAGQWRRVPVAPRDQRVRSLARP
jgi:hypothetical protein